MKKNPRLHNLRFLSKRLGFLVSINHGFTTRTLSGLVKFSNGAYANISIPNGFLPGSLIYTTSLPSRLIHFYNLGDTVLLFWLDKRSIFYNILSSYNYKNKYARAAGTFCMYIDEDEEKEYISVRLPSGLIKLIYSLTYVTLGQNSNIIRERVVYGKAGIRSIYGFRPSVRGVAKNPVDHPNGGRTKTKSPEKTPWGLIAKSSK